MFSEKVYESFETIFGKKFIYYACVRNKGIILVLNYDKARQELVKQSISALSYDIKESDRNLWEFHIKYRGEHGKKFDR